MAFLDELKARLASLRATLFRMNENQQHLYLTAYSFLGRDASPLDWARDDVGCSDSVSRVLQKAFPELRFPTFLSTRELYAYFTNSPSFKEEQTPEFGRIILSVTGMGNGKVSNGHVGIIGRNTSQDGSLWVMSNDSRFGTWEANLTVTSWNRYYRDRGGMVTHIFRVV